jgi:hypothetical protein
LDQVLALAVFLERFSKEINMTCKVALLNERICPHSLKDLFLRDDLTGVFRENAEEFYLLQRQIDRLVFAPQHALFHIQAKPAEFA